MTVLGVTCPQVTPRFKGKSPFLWLHMYHSLLERGGHGVMRCADGDKNIDGESLWYTEKWNLYPLSVVAGHLLYHNIDSFGGFFPPFLVH